MNAPAPQPSRSPSPAADNAGEPTPALLPEPAPLETIRNPLRRAQDPELAETAQLPEAAAHGTSGAREKSEPIRNLFEACLRMLKLTGGSQYWTGDTQAALEFMEGAVAAALETGALRSPEPAPSAVVPEIVASVAASVDCTLHLAGIEAESRRAI